MSKKEIGGFFQLELTNKGEYHKTAIKLNSARYCLQYILKAKKYGKIYLPFYICNSVLQPILEEGLKYEFYSINDNFEPVFDKKIENDECFLYVNYFGLNYNSVENAKERFNNIIVDNTQAFFEKPLPDTDIIYSPRKFFGVPDGGYLYTDKALDERLERNISYDKCSHLLKRIDISAAESYELFKNNEAAISMCGMKKMSALTQSILAGVDYEVANRIRNINFALLCRELNKYNELNFDATNINGPMIYPLLTKNKELRQRLISNKIYVATYWNEVKSRVNKNSFEYMLSESLIPLPIDQRYDLDDMKYIVNSLVGVQ